MISSLKIIDASTVLAGPSVGMFFAELGADVLKIENPNFPDVTRSWRTASERTDSPISSYFSSINYGKKYQHLDLKIDSDRKEFLDLITDADILITNFKKGDDEKFGITDEILQNINPRLIHGKISGFGLDSDRVAYDLILQAETGYMSINGTQESGPLKMPVAFIDVLAAHHLKEAILIALLDRTQTNLGKTVHVSLYDAAVASLINQSSGYLMSLEVPKRMGSLHPTIAPYGEIFTTSDHQEITFAIGSDTHFHKLCLFLGIEELANDTQFENNHQRVINRAELFEILQDKISKYKAVDVLNWMETHHVPCGKIKNIAEVFENPKAKALIRTEIIEGQETKRVSSIAFQTVNPE